MGIPDVHDPMPRHVYRYIWSVTGHRQVKLCALTAIVIALTAAPLELQRRITDDAFGPKNLKLLALYCALYLVLLLVQGTTKYYLNVSRGRTVEIVSRVLRLKIFTHLSDLAAKAKGEAAARGATVSIIASEAEDLAGFVGDSFSMPLQQGGTAVAIFAYLLWVNPLIAGFAALLYVPQLFIVPPTQHGINRNSVNYAKTIRRAGDVIVGLTSGKEANAPLAGRYRRMVNQAFELRIRIYRMKFFLTALGNFLDALGPLIVFAVGGWLVIQGKVPVSTIVVFISGVQKVSDPWDQLITFYRTASNSQAKYDLIRQTLENGTPPAAKNGRTSATKNGKPAARDERKAAS
jgi:ABC-type multidrug transport system fused ATPase/permease subunit